MCVVDSCSSVEESDRALVEPRTNAPVAVPVSSRQHSLLVYLLRVACRFRLKQFRLSLPLKRSFVLPMLLVALG